ncbi:non-ribosomal peptide synthetase [Methylosinus sp. LW3]|uniref:non-ribosomal peptide synthetase n=1 Tax=Methylosinus sp. LW3 TaxID=107635 RepID=UPI000466A4BE|nr:non-ribosomal peptide synthetase [Methylosinus sp. LW3]
MNTTQLLQEMQTRRIDVTLKEGRLQFKAPKGALTEEIKKALGAHKDALIAALNVGAGKAPPPIFPAPLSSSYRVSFSQERLWFLDQFESSSYAMPTAVRLSGHLELDVFRSCVEEIVARHGSLRTVFESIEGEARQRVLGADAVALACPIVDLGGVAAQERTAKALSLVEEESRRPFDLTAGPLLRVLVIDMGSSDPHEHIVVFTMHHIVSDGWSTEVLLREFAALYEARLAGRDASLPELPIQYVDYAVWQREWLAGDVQDRQLAYWREALAGARFTLDLPTDRPRPPVQDNAGRTLSFMVPAALAGKLRELTRARGATLYMTLLAAFFILLARWSGEKDICVGTPVANRRRVELEGLIGFFVNTLVMRGDLTGDPDFFSFLARVRAMCLGAQEHQDLPFERLVEALAPARDLSRSPLFQAMFSLQNAPARAFSLQGLDIEPFEADSGTSKFDLSFEFSEEPDGRLGGAAQYATALFERETVERMIAHYLRLLDQIVATPHARLGELEMLPRAERDLLIHGFNATSADFPRDLSIVDLFVTQARRSPETVALSCKGETLSYDALDRRSNQLARMLIERGAGPEKIVGLCLERSVEMVVSLIAILKSGAAYLPLDPDYPRARLAFMIDDAKPLVTIADASLQERLPEAAPRLILDATVDAHSDAPLEPCANPQNIAYVIYTSGSTGKPKGIAILHQNAVAMIFWARTHFHGDGARRMLASTSICFDLSAFELFLPLCFGGEVILVENALALLSSGHRLEPQIVNTVPSAMRELLRLDALPSSIRYVNLAGEPFHPTIARALLGEARLEGVFNLYGPSECTTYSTFQRLADSDADHPPIGGPIDNTQVYLLDARLEPAPLGVAGELYIGGEGVARGYLGRPELTAERFVPDPFGAPGARLYRTGDLGRRRSDGQILFLGRIDHQVKIRGFRIELGEIEAALAELPDIRAAVVVAHEDAGGDKRLVAYVAADAFDAFDVDRARIALRATLPDYMVPAAILALPDLPLNANGKIDRKALPQISERADKAVEPPRTQTEWIILQAFKEALGLERVGMHDNFFELGGNSILGLKLVERIRRSLSEDMFVAAIFRAPTPAMLARLLSDGLQTHSSPLVRLCGAAGRGQVYCLHPAGGSIVRYRPLALRLENICSVYGVQSRTLLEPNYRAHSIHEMAQDYAGLLRELQPVGPYRLIGWSAGGALALATAAELERGGETVDFIGLLDPTIDAQRDGPGASMMDHLQSFAEFQDIRLELTEEDRRNLIEAGAELDERARFIAAGIWGRDHGLWSDVSTEVLALLYDDSVAFRTMLGEYQVEPLDADLHIWWAKRADFNSERRWTRGVTHSKIVETSHERLVVDPVAHHDIAATLGRIIRAAARPA